MNQQTATSGKPHLDQRTIRRILAGEVLGGERETLREHLSCQCGECEEYLAQRHGPAPAPVLSIEEAEAIRLRVLDAVLPERAAEERPSKVVRLETARRKGVPGRLRTWAISLAAAAAVLLFLVPAIKRPLVPGHPTIKSASYGSYIVAVAEETGPKGRSVSYRVFDRAKIHARSVLLFRLLVLRPGHVYLLKRDRSELGLLFPFDHDDDRMLKPGEYELRRRGKVQAYFLEGLKGRQEFLLVHSPRPMKFPGDFGWLALRRKGKRPTTSATVDTLGIQVYPGG